ncbi:concanavalin A-like lectin/glucanase domain-containing protein [Macrophomina phaseolina]|uniref:Concanavalin A-like lectin/glucanase domain-containing protein n=1 Tax=Macrophomina phaseolina TaxID=35725 RepID=A0ABQ8G0H2_9PEZI|nr:concanavalin A-like lectin/glucanase domain-containing protein [Macrophomina phaseolina]
MARLLYSLAAALLIHSTTAGYTLVRDYKPDTFFDHFGFFDGEDPTHGTVEYQSRQGAEARHLISNTDTSVRIGVDSTNKVPDLRPSVRIFSNETFNQGILLVDVKHMPAGCGTWPALWLLGDGEWPANGEIDILEGANDQTTNYMTLHTSDAEGEDCSLTAIPASGGDGTGALGYSKKDYSGTVATNECAWKPETNDNSGCQIQAPTGQTPVYAGTGKTTNAIVPTFGDALNRAGGGTLAMQWTSNGIKIWFFGRTQYKPSDIAAATDFSSTAYPIYLLPSNDAWGKPLAHFSGPACDWERRFQDMRIVINTDFCGDWGAATWPAGSCPASTGYDSCESFVKEKPEAFTEAYWEFGAFRWFEWRDPAPATSSTTATTTTSLSTSSTSSAAATTVVIVTRTSTAIPSSTVVESTFSTALTAPTVIFSTYAAPSTTARPFTYDPLPDLAEPSSTHVPASSTSPNVAAETSVDSSISSSTPPADESKKGNAQYLVNGKLPLGGARSVRVSPLILSTSALIGFAALMG